MCDPQMEAYYTDPRYRDWERKRDFLRDRPQNRTTRLLIATYARKMSELWEAMNSAPQAMKDD